MKTLGTYWERDPILSGKWPLANAAPHISSGAGCAAAGAQKVLPFFLVIAAAARGLYPGALLVLPSVQRMVSHVRIVKLRAKLPPAQIGKLIA
jgi:hypothetical protein